MVFLDVRILRQPEACVGAVGQLFADDGALASADTVRFFTTFITACAAWVEKIAAPR